MSFLLKLQYNNKIICEVSKKDALLKLSDINKIAELHPRVKSVENISENCWQWQMTPSGAGGSYFDIIYACSYNINHEEFTINWTPVEDIGNAVVHGRWCVFEQYAKIYLDIVIKVPFPKVFCKIANQIANKIFSISMNKHLKQLENYLKE